MIYYFVHDAEGKIWKTAAVPTITEIAAQTVPEGHDLKIGHADIGKDYWTGTEIAPRPPLPEIPTALSVNDILIIEHLPVGTVWRFQDVTDPALSPAFVGDGVVGDDQRLVESMEERGRYELELTPPWPFVARTGVIAVS